MVCDRCMGVVCAVAARYSSLVRARSSVVGAVAARFAIQVWYLLIRSCPTRGQSVVSPSGIGNLADYKILSSLTFLSFSLSLFSCSSLSLALLSRSSSLWRGNARICTRSSTDSRPPTGDQRWLAPHHAPHNGRHPYPIAFVDP
jgi:hypothetical protein